MIKDLKLVSGYLTGASFSTVFVLKMAENPLRLLFILLAIHPLAMIGVLLLRRKYG